MPRYFVHRVLASRARLCVRGSEKRRSAGRNNETNERPITDRVFERLINDATKLFSSHFTPAHRRSAYENLARFTTDRYASGLKTCRMTHKGGVSTCVRSNETVDRPAAGRGGSARG